MLGADGEPRVVEPFLDVLALLFLMHHAAGGRRVETLVGAIGRVAPEGFVVQPHRDLHLQRLEGAGRGGGLLPTADANVAIDVAFVLGRLVYLVDQLIPDLSRREREVVFLEGYGREPANLDIDQGADLDDAGRRP